jgi:L-2,4-diaminobutyric acid acetyltransferase
VPAKATASSSTLADVTAVNVRHPVPADAAAIYRLVCTDGGLDRNSLYCYLLVGRDFSRTSLVATRLELGGEVLAGFVSAYRPPDRPETLFVWQVGVAQAARRQGLAVKMLHRLLSLPQCGDVTFLEATVTPSNEASRRLFTRLASDLGASLRVATGFTADLFGGAEPPGETAHEAEDCFVIGPLGEARLNRKEEADHEGV